VKEEVDETRLHGRMKMGYYPTPPSVVERIRTFLHFPDGNVNVLDPCCGEGLALRSLVEGTEATTYGIELDEYRATRAMGNLDHVLHCGYEDARVSNSAFGCMLLNPPYDWEAVASGEGHERKEKGFLKGTVKYLQPDGVLVYVVPQKAVRGDIARILSYRFHDFSPYRFPDEEYDRFKQVVVFGKKKERGELDRDAVDRLDAIPNEDLTVIPYADNPVYDVPSSPLVRLFRSSVIDEVELERELKKSTLWKKLHEYGENAVNGVGRPPLPLHTGHLGLLLASGSLDGVVGEGPDRHIVRGKAEKVTHTEQEYQGDVLVERQIETYRVCVKVLKRNGEIETLM